MKCKLALMVPCCIDMLYQHVGVATLELLEKLGVDVASMCKIRSSFHQRKYLNMETINA